MRSAMPRKSRCRPAQESERQDKLNECNPETFETFLKENARKFRGLTRR